MKNKDETLGQFASNQPIRMIVVPSLSQRLDSIFTVLFKEKYPEYRNVIKLKETLDEVLFFISSNFDYMIFSRKTMNSFLEFTEKVFLQRVATHDQLFEYFPNQISFFSDYKIVKAEAKVYLVFDMFMYWYLKISNHDKNIILNNKSSTLFWQNYLNSREALSQKKNREKIESKLEGIVNEYKTVKEKKYKQSSRVPWYSTQRKLAELLRRLKEQGTFKTYKEAYEYGEKYFIIEGKIPTSEKLRNSWDRGF
jgi:hypothetical protein